MADIEAAAAAMSSAGVQFEQMPVMAADMGSYELWLAFFRDSEGNVMSLMSEKQK